MTTLIRGLSQMKPSHQGGVVTIGNFDGVHKGHQVLLQKVRQQAIALKAPSIVIVFEPQPLEYFEQNRVQARLTRLREKFCAFVMAGIDHVLVLQFNQTLASLSADDFITRILVNGLKIRHIIIGDDFRFGFQRLGDFDFLEQAGKCNDFVVEKMSSVILENQRVSSTLIRQALAYDDLERAQILLGRPYSMMGRIIHGNQLGRKLGFPTANIKLHRRLTPLQGIYAVRMHGIAKEALPGVANIGIRPAIGGTHILLEVYLFDFNQDIYGQYVSVEFCKKIRNEAYFSDLKLLKVAIAKDVMAARHYFNDESTFSKNSEGVGTT